MENVRKRTNKGVLFTFKQVFSLIPDGRIRAFRCLMKMFGCSHRVTGILKDGSKIQLCVEQSRLQSDGLLVFSKGFGRLAFSFEQSAAYIVGFG